MRYRYCWWGVLWLLLVVTSPVLAQIADCTRIERAWAGLESFCIGLSAGNACYGHETVTRIPYTPQDSHRAFFSRIGDKAPLNSLVTIRTLGFDTTTGGYGLAVLNVGANLPRFNANATSSTEGIKILLAGNAAITNVVPSIIEPQSAAPIGVTTAVETRLYDYPTLKAPVREIVVAGINLSADGTLENGLWVRVLYLDTFFWIPRDKLMDNPAIGELPDLAPLSPMQSFFYTTGANSTDCTDAVSQISIEGPETGPPAPVFINGVEMRIRSLATFTSDTIIVHRGSVEAIFTPDSTQIPITVGINAGFTLDIEFDVNGHMIAKERPRPSTDDEIHRGVLGQTGLNHVANANGWESHNIPLEGTPVSQNNAGLDATTSTEQNAALAATPAPAISSQPLPEQPTAQPEQTAPLPLEAALAETPGLVALAVNCEIQEVVEDGESLYRLAIKHNASMPAIMTVNNLSDPALLSLGQILCIPRPGSGFVPLPDTPAPATCAPIAALLPPYPPEPASPAGLFDCSGQ
jgi:hypothetical protein